MAKVGAEGRGSFPVGLADLKRGALSKLQAPLPTPPTLSAPTAPRRKPHAPILPRARPEGRPSSKQLQDRARANPTRALLPERVAKLLQGGIGTSPSGFSEVEALIRRHTLVEVAAGAGVSIGTVSMLWAGKRRCSLEVGLRLCVFLGLDPYDLCAWINHRSRSYRDALRGQRSRER